MKHRCLTASVILLAIAGVACNRDKKAGQMAALDRGFAAGLVTRSEYESKKALILGTGAAPAAIPVPVATTPVPSPSEVPQPQPVEQPAAPSPPPAAPSRETEDSDSAEPAPLAGCQNTVARPGKEKGRQERFFPAPAARVRQAAIGALEALDFNVSRSTSRDLEANRRRHIGLVGSGGERLLLRFEDASEGGQRGTLVTGETRKSLLGRASQKSWTNAVLTQTGCMLRKGVR